MINNINSINFNNHYVKNSVNTSFQAQTAAPETTDRLEKHKKINLKEGCELIWHGIAKQAADMTVSIIRHPVKTLAIIGATSLGIMALPFLGIPTAVGGGVLAVGFAGLALGKCAYHTAEFIKNNEDGSYDIARKNLQQIGGDTFDLALSAPFAPSAVKSIKKFVKYGKAGYNPELIKEVASTKGLRGKWGTIRNADKELSEQINFRAVLDKNFPTPEGMSSAELAALKKELLEFNISDKKLTQLILDKWAEAKGLHVQPRIEYATLCESTGGWATPSRCSITLNDFKYRIKKGFFENYRLINRKLSNGIYEDTYLNTKTGAMIKETISEDMAKAYNNYLIKRMGFSNKAQKILALIHEREHIHQYARIASQKGIDWAHPTPAARQLYQQMVDEMPKVQAGSTQAQEIEALAQAKTVAQTSYLKNAREIGARNAEMQAMENPRFQTLDVIYKAVEKIKEIPMKVNIWLNSLRTINLEAAEK